MALFHAHVLAWLGLTRGTRCVLLVRQGFSSPSQQGYTWRFALNRCTRLKEMRFEKQRPLYYCTGSQRLIITDFKAVATIFCLAATAYWLKKATGWRTGSGRGRLEAVGHALTRPDGASTQHSLSKCGHTLLNNQPPDMKNASSLLKMVKNNSTCSFFWSVKSFPVSH